MAKLTGQSIASSYDQLLIVNDADGISGSLQAIESADTGGSASSLKISTSKVEVIPASNSTALFEVSQADGTPVLSVDTSNARVGVGTDAPQSILHLSSGTTDQPLITIDHESSSDSSQGGTVNFVKRDSDGAVLADDIVLGDIGFRGTEAGGTERSGAMIRGRTQDAWTDGGNCGTELAFYTAQTTSSGTQQRMCIQKDGKVGIGTASPQGMLHVGGSETNTSSDT